MPGKLYLEDLPLTEQAPANLIRKLEQRTLRLVDGLDAARHHAVTFREQASRLEKTSQVLSEELASLRAAEAEHQVRQALLEKKIETLEAQRHELQEECRRLRKSNDELEPYAQGLQKRSESSGVLSPEPRPVGVQPVAAEGAGQAVTPAPSPQALLKEWYGRYDSAFFKGHTQPLKVGIHEDLVAAEPWPEKLVRRALACYVNLPRYLKAVRHGAQRIDLEGQPSGSVDEGAADHAKRKLERLQTERRSKRKATRVAEQGARNSRLHEPHLASGKALHGKKPSTHEKGPQDHRHHQKNVQHRNNEALPDDPSERLQHKLDALMARHVRQ